MSCISDLKKYCAQARNKNTEKKTNSCVANFQEYIVEKGFPKEKKLTEYTYEELDALLGKFFFISNISKP